MGCITSSQHNTHDDAAPVGEVKATSNDMKTRFANVDADILGDYKDEAIAKLAFEYGRTANIYRIVTPPFDPQTHHPKNEHREEKKEGEGEQEEEEEEVKEVRWFIFNDSKSDAKVESTFFHAEHVRSATGSDNAAASSVKIERTGTGVAKATADVPAGATVAFVEGPIKGYMWKCLVHDPRTNTFENAVAVT